MSGARHSKHKKTKAAHRSVKVPAVTESLCQQQPDSGEGDSVKEANQNPPGFLKDWRVNASILVSLLALFAYFTQACYMRKAMRVDQRAWVSIPFPNSFPLSGASIPVVTRIVNSGKTPAKGLLVDVFASPLNKGDKVSVGDFSTGHPHERLHAPGVVFPNDPVPVDISVGTYLPEGGQQLTVPDETLRQDVASGKRFILFYGRATYHDVFEVEHYTQFCTGTGPGIPSDVLKECLSYNAVDSNEE
jgi:hypothetical protein